MPERAPKPCPKCSHLTTNRDYCDICRGVRKAERETYRPEYAALYRTPRWKKESKDYLARHPRCVECKERSRIVDHIKPHRGDLTLFWDKRNWQPMCKRHHDRKTARGQ